MSRPVTVDLFRVPLAVLVALVSLLSAAPAAPAGAATPPLHGPVLEGDFPDPDVVHDPRSGRFYAFSTNVEVAGAWVNVPVRSSPDLTDWSSVEADALPVLPGWARSGLTWAPGVARIGRSWRLYFTARHAASGRQCIGVAVAETVTGPYTPAVEPIVCQLDRGGSIDPAPFRDPTTGRWWLHWKSDENAPGASGVSRLWAAELDGDATSVTGDAHVLLTYAGGVEEPLIENPTMVYGGGRFWLGYSANWWESGDYHDHLAVCDGPAGPCSRVGDPGDPWLSNRSGIAGPGGAAFFTDAAGQVFVAFHGWTGPVGYRDGGARALHIERVTFAAVDGVPVLRPDLGRSPIATLELVVPAELGDLRPGMLLGTRWAGWGV